MFEKKTFVDSATIITAEWLNSLQDELIRLALATGTRIWLAPKLKATDVLWDYATFDKMVGAAEPNEATVQAGDPIICGDGGVVFVSKVVSAGNTYMVLTTAGKNTSGNPSDGAAMYLKGQTVYEYAKEAGFPGTEAEFKTKLAAL